MRLTKKQLEEIDFLEKFYVKGPTTDEQRSEYISVSVLGQGSGRVDGVTTNKAYNPLLLAKRSLDIDVKAWRKDIRSGLFSAQHFITDFNHPYATKIFNTLQ
jgi:hypothetical protein